jgi:hypothetical protein
MLDRGSGCQHVREQRLARRTLAAKADCFQHREPLLDGPFAAERRVVGEGAEIERLEGLEVVKPGKLAARWRGRREQLLGVDDLSVVQVDEQACGVAGVVAAVVGEAFEFVEA